MTHDRPVFGILLMLGFCVIAPLGDSIAKLLGDRMSVGLLLFVRFLIQAICLMPIVLLSSRTLRMSRRLYALTALRTLFHIIGIGTMFLSLRYLPLADAVAIAFVMPFIMLILGKTILHEDVGPHRLAACTVGFLGTLLVIQPNFTAVGPAALLPLIVAVDFALFMLVTRSIAKEVDPISLQTVSGFMAIAFLAPFLFLLGPWSGWSALALVLPSSQDFGMLLFLGLLGTIAHLFMTWSLRFAPASTLAPMQYLEIPVATFFGWLIFRDLPNHLAALGILITVLAGLYIIWREQSQSRRLKSLTKDQLAQS